jgi:excisionase family DNA binding protein
VGRKNKLLTIKQVAEMLSVSVTSVYRLIYSRSLPFYKIGGVLRFNSADVDVYLQQARVESKQSWT